MKSLESLYTPRTCKPDCSGCIHENGNIGGRPAGPFQICLAQELGLPSDASFVDISLAALEMKRQGYAQELHLPDTATWDEINTAYNARQVLRDPKYVVSDLRSAFLYFYERSFRLAIEMNNRKSNA